MTGRVDFTSMGMSAALPLIRDGQLTPFAVSSANRSRTLPDVPTTLESGLADFDYNYWMGLFVPAKTPRDRRSARTGNRKGMANARRDGKIQPQGIEPMPMTPAEFDALIKKEIQTNIALVKAANLKFN